MTTTQNETADEPVEPVAVRMDGPLAPVPLKLFPPGFDLTGYLILDPATSEWTQGTAGLTEVLYAEAISQLDPQESDGADDAGATTEMGFYRVVRLGASVWGVTNYTTLSGYVEIPIEIGLTNLEFNGVGLLDGEVGAFGAVVETNDLGQWLLKWDTTLVPNGSHTILLSADVGPEEPAVWGPSKIVNIDNNVTSDEFMATFGSQMWLNAVLKPGAGDYEIKVHDGDSGQYLGSFTGYTADGNISFVWDLTDGLGNTFTNQVFREDYYLSPSLSLSTGGKLASESPAWHPAPQGADQSETLFEDGVLGFLGQLFRRKEPTWSEDDFATAWGEFEFPAGTGQAIDQMMRWGVNDTLASPIAAHPYTFMNPPNGWNTGFSFKLIPESKALLLSQLAESNYRNLFWYGHGRDNNFGYSFRGPNSERLPGVRITSDELRTALGNRRGKVLHAYRLVFLNSCYGITGDLPRAFGIDPRPLSAAHFQTKGVRPRAIIGATSEASGAFDPIDHLKYGQSLTIFFSLWMEEVYTVQDCLSAGKAPSGTFEDRIPLDESLSIGGATDLRRVAP